MKKKAKKTGSSTAIAALKAKKTFRLADALRLGISQATLSRLVAKGIIGRSGRGIYYSPDIEWKDSVELDFVTASELFSKKTYIGGLSALHYYDLIHTPPRQVWVVAPIEKKSADKRYRIIRTRLSQKTGITVSDDYRIASIERAIIDAFYFSYIWGKPLALRAAREAIISGKTTTQKLSQMAAKLRCGRLFDKYRDFISPEALGIE